MIRILLLTLATCAVFAGTVLAQAPSLRLTLGNGALARDFMLPLPEGASTLPCERQAIMNLHCLRADAAKEKSILDALSASILSQGWTAVGDDRNSRPHMMAFRMADEDNPCPHMLLITSATEATAPRPPLAAGRVEIMIAKTLDAACLFDMTPP